MGEGGRVSPCSAGQPPAVPAAWDALGTQIFPLCPAQWCAGVFIPRALVRDKLC